MNKWTQHVKDWAAKHNMKYSQALKDEKCKKAYSKLSKGKEIKGGQLTPQILQQLIQLVILPPNPQRLRLFRQLLVGHLNQGLNAIDNHFDNIQGTPEYEQYNNHRDEYWSTVIVSDDEETTPTDTDSDNIEGGAMSDYFSAVTKGRNDYPPKMREILKKYGDKTILRMFACRTPVPALLTSALNAISLGEFGKRWENQPYDKLFHLDLRIEVLEDTQRRKVSTVLLEKNEVLNALVNPKKSKDTECKLILNVPRPMTINKMLAGAQQIQGDKFFKYSAYNNNCQDFIMALLKGVNAGTQENYDFIKQETKELFRGLPGTRKFANTVTDLGATFNTIIEGAGPRERIEQAQKLAKETENMLNEKRRKEFLQKRLTRANPNVASLKDTVFKYGPNSQKGIQERKQYELKRMSEEDRNINIQGTGIPDSIYDVLHFVKPNHIIPFLATLGVSTGILYGIARFLRMQWADIDNDLAELARMGMNDRRRVAAEIIDENNLNREQVLQVAQIGRDLESQVSDLSELNFVESSDSLPDSSLHSSEFDMSPASSEFDLSPASSEFELSMGSDSVKGKGATASISNEERQLRQAIRNVSTELRSHRAMLDTLHSLPRGDQRRGMIPNTLLVISDLNQQLNLLVNMLNERIEAPIETTAEIVEQPILNAQQVDDMEYDTEDILPEASQLGTGIHKGENYYIQSVVFDKSKFDLKKAREWLKKNNYVSKKPDTTDTQIRFRQVDSSYIKNKGFDKFRTKKIGRNSGISLIISYK